MSNVISESADATAASGKPSSAFAAPAPDTDDPARHVGELFRRLTLASETFPPQAFNRVVAAILVALAKATLIEAERQAERLRNLNTPSRSDIKLPTPGRRVDVDGGFDIDDRG